MSLQSTDQIADLITRIRNAIMVGKTEIRVPTSKLKVAVTDGLVNAGYIDSYEVEDGKTSRCASCHHQQRWREHQNHRDYQSFETYFAAFTLAPPKSPVVKSTRRRAHLYLQRHHDRSRSQKQHLGGEILVKVY